MRFIIVPILAVFWLNLETLAAFVARKKLSQDQWNYKFSFGYGSILTAVFVSFVLWLND